MVADVSIWVERLQSNGKYSCLQVGLIRWNWLVSLAVSVLAVPTVILVGSSVLPGIETHHNNLNQNSTLALHADY